MDNTIKEQGMSETLIENYGQCYECKQPYTSEEDWCNDCDVRNYKYRINSYSDYSKNYLKNSNLELKQVGELSLNERWRFKQFGLCHKCCRPLTQHELCINCSENNLKCRGCNQSYSFKNDSWCNDCDAKSFLKEDIEYCKKINELTNYEKWQFKTFGFCHNCKQLKMDELCHICNSLELQRKCLIRKYGQCNKCSQPYPPEYKIYSNYERWCDNCDAKGFLEESEIIGYNRKLNELSTEEKLNYKTFGFCHKCIKLKVYCDRYRLLGCPDCKGPNTGKAWCNKCDPGRFIREGKTSGSSEMDNLIHESQRKAEHYHRNLEWISFDRLKDIKQIGEGGFSKIYSATWLDGIPQIFNGKKSRSIPIIVVLKKIKDSNKMTDIFTNEVEMHYKFQRNYNDSLAQFYGITKDPETEDFMLVLEYANNGSLKNHIKNNYLNLNWDNKLEILICIAKTLNVIHKSQCVHRDLHTGNILNFEYFTNPKIISYETKITDLGLAESLLRNNPHSSKICGVLPYIAPEVLNEKPYTFASDIYSFGIIMIEILTGEPPFGNERHDKELAFAICKGLRPRVAEGTPQCYIDLINKCLDADPKNRPTAFSLANELSLKSYAIPRNSPKVALHPGAVYSSRFFNFPNLPKSRNSMGVRIENLDVSDTKLVERYLLENLKEFEQMNLDDNPPKKRKYDVMEM